MELFDAATVNAVNDHARRAAVLEELSPLVRIGISADVAERKARAASIRESLRDKYEEKIFMLQTNAYRFTMMMLADYSTESLEYTAAQITEVNSLFDRLHHLMELQSGWKKATGVNLDQMYRDTIFLRSTELRPSGWEAYAMMETYAALGIPAGSIHLIPAGPELETAKAVMGISRVSRKITSMQLSANFRNSEEFRDMDPIERNDARSKNFREARTQQHLTAEIVQYLRDHPDYGSGLLEYMLERKEPLSVLNLDHFNDYITSHSTLNTGVL